MADNAKLTRAADNIRVLAASMVEKAKSGHPGGAMGGADFINVLYTEFLRYDPDDLRYPFRDRLFLDPGHMSPMLYSTLALAGNYTMDDLKAFRQWGSCTPGHPEVDVLRGVDYKTLLFFIGLFISVAGLEQTGVLKLIAQFISNISGGSIKVVILIILLLSAVCSALIDNIPFAATMVPVVQSIAATQGMDLSVLAWALSLGTDLGGNATPIGASANVVATSVSAKSGHPISWGKYCKYCVPATVLVIAVSLGCLFLRYL